MENDYEVKARRLLKVTHASLLTLQDQRPLEGGVAFSSWCLTLVLRLAKLGLHEFFLIDLMCVLRGREIIL